VFRLQVHDASRSQQPKQLKASKEYHTADKEYFKMTELFMDKGWFGEFFVHLDQYDRRFPGKIAYSPEKRVILTYTITGHDVPPESDVVYGILDDGKKCTLLGKFTPQDSDLSDLNGLMTRRGEAGFSFLLVGEFVTPEDTFSEIDFSLTSLQEFFFPDGFKDLVNYSNKPLFSLTTSYGEIAFRNSAGLSFLNNMTFDVYINNEDAVREFRKALNDIKVKYKDCLFLTNDDVEYRFFINIKSGATISKIIDYIWDIASLFAILIYSPVYPESIRVVKQDNMSINFIEVFPSMMLDRRIIETCTKKKSFFHFPINKTNIDLHSILDFWLNHSKDYQIIILSIQRETGIRNEHSLHG